MFQTKVRKVGNSSVVTMSSEMLAALDVKDGDTVYVTRSDDNGLKISVHDPSCDRQAHRRSVHYYKTKIDLQRCKKMRGNYESG